MVYSTVLPEIQRRLDEGELAQSSLPYEIYAFRLLQYRESGRNISRIELNEQVKISAEMKAKRAIKAGELVTTADVDPEYCLVGPQEVNGNRAAYFIWARSFLDFVILFDFGPNAPHELEPPIDMPKFPYPLAEPLNLALFLLPYPIG